MEFFSEHIVKKKKTVQDIMTIIISIMVALLFAYLLFIQFAAGKLVILIPVEIALVIFGIFVAITSLNVEYEYSLTNGDLDIDKIVAKRKRKNIVKLSLRDVEYFALLDDNHIKVAEDTSIAKVIDASSTIDSPNVYFIIYYYNNQKTCLLFEPTGDMIDNMSRYIPRSLNHTI